MGFVLGAWSNMRYTLLSSSVVLALPFPVAMGIATFANGQTTAAAVAFFVVYALVHMLLYPLARELYFGLTDPVRRGLSGWFFYGPLALVALVFKVYIYVIVGAFAIPLGLVGFIYLGLRARRQLVSTRAATETVHIRR